MTSGFQMMSFEKLGQLPSIRRDIEDPSAADKGNVCMSVFDMACPTPFTDNLNSSLLLLVHDGPSPRNAPKILAEYHSVPSTLKTINAELAKRGHNARLERGTGYFYFWTGEAADWLDRTVKVPKVSSLTLDQWIGEFQRLKKLNAEIMKAKPSKNRARRMS